MTMVENMLMVRLLIVTLIIMHDYDYGTVIMCVCMCVCTHACMHVCMYVCVGVYACMYACMHA